MAASSPFGIPNTQEARIALIEKNLRKYIAEQKQEPTPVFGFPVPVFEVPVPEVVSEVALPHIYIDPNCSVCNGVGYSTGGVRCVLCESIQS